MSPHAAISVGRKSRHATRHAPPPAARPSRRHAAVTPHAYTAVTQPSRPSRSRAVTFAPLFKEGATASDLGGKFATEPFG